MDNDCHREVTGTTIQGSSQWKIGTIVARMEASHDTSKSDRLFNASDNATREPSEYPLSRTTQFLLAAKNGDPQAIQNLFPIVYDELRSIANHHLKDNQLAKEYSSTDLVHEVYMKLIDQTKVDLNSRTHFFALCSKVMRQLLVDRARHNRAARRGSGVLHVSLDDAILMRTDDNHVLAIEEALKSLEELDKPQAEIVEMRFYGGMTVAEIAAYLGKSKRSVEAEWTMIRAWLRRELSGQSSEPIDGNDTSKPDPKREQTD